ncbi:hypothetical protein HOG17_00975 [Candidatus Peregrinibacteria bacterium]|jgi:hypothetical protein|nr:hypothetical protein [Candidatus Peregrinibacteria bacterium]MBT4148575.1 hypothetical protein [Candidatus Peregrinibacteria bacterium]MBT4366252.1 hypothetical protein [Candidatus Peregrinibacteria bacterium]MBT4456352.1 hypothetical protein [Candidatus Peregrinibacteria bacterium]
MTDPEDTEKDGPQEVRQENELPEAPLYGDKRIVQTVNATRKSLSLSLSGTEEVEERDTEKVFRINERIITNMIVDSSNTIKSFQITVTTEQGHKTINLMGYIPQNIKIELAIGPHFIPEGKDGRKTIQISELDLKHIPEKGLISAFHEIGHAIDEAKHPEKYPKDNDRTLQIIEAGEKGANEEMSKMLDQIREEEEVEIIPKVRLESLNKLQLLSCQVDSIFRDKHPEKPNFLPLQYDEAQWERRFNIHKETREELNVQIRASADSLFSRLGEKGVNNLTANEILQILKEEFPSIYIEEAIFFNDLESFAVQIFLARFNPKTGKSRMKKSFQRKLSRIMLDEELGLINYVAHQKLLTDEYRAEAKVF